MIIGEPGNGIIKKDVLAKITAGGYTHNGLYELVPIGNQDFSQVLPKIKQNEPDILLLGLYGQDPVRSSISRSPVASSRN